MRIRQYFCEQCKQHPHLILMLAGLLVGSASIWYTIRSEDVAMRRALMVQARSIDLALDWSSMYGDIEASSVDAQKLTPYRERMAKICAVYPNCRAVYLMRQNVKKQVVFLLDSSPPASALYLPPGTIYTEVSADVLGIFTSDNTLTEGLYTDRWGTWVSAFVPHLFANNKMVIVGIDIEAKDWNKSLFKSAILPGLVTLAFLIVMAVYSFLWHSKNKQNGRLEQSAIQLLKLAHEDSLTGLPNRRLLEDRLQQLIALEGRNGSGFTVLYVDLDGFKKVNDTFGHDVGDQFLCLIAGRLTNMLRLEDTVARLSGDEFVILLPRIECQEGAEKVAGKIIKELARAFHIGGQEMAITASIGAVVFSSKLSTPQALIKAADDAMYVAKKAGANQCHFSNAEPVGLKCDAYYVTF